MVGQGLLFLGIDQDDALHALLTHGGRILLIAVIASVAVTVIQHVVTPVVRVTVRQQMAGEPQVDTDKRVETLSHVVYRTTWVVIFIAALLTALPELGLNVAPLIAGVGIVGLAVGFGAQNLVRDILSGLFVLLENQYGKGDVIRIAGVSGRVEDINLRRTVLRDGDGAVHFIPNGEIKTASNLTKGFSRVNLNVAVAYEADIDRVFAVINQVGEGLSRDSVYAPKIREAPHALRVDRLGDALVEVKVVGVTEPDEQWSVTGELRRRLKTAFDEAGIRMTPPAPAGPQAAAGE